MRIIRNIGKLKIGEKIDSKINMKIITMIVELSYTSQFYSKDYRNLRKS